MTDGSSECAFDFDGYILVKSEKREAKSFSLLSFHPSKKKLYNT